MVGEGRRVILRNKDTGEFIDDFTSQGKRKHTASFPFLFFVASFTFFILYLLFFFVFLLPSVV
jgi:hypothetical protein